MKFKLFSFVLLFTIISGCASSNVQKVEGNPSKLFQQYKQYKENSILPDFSYVGYHRGDDPIPEINNYKIFDVRSFGAVADDGVSDKAAIQKAISAANKNGSGIVLFPKGRFLVNEPGDGDESIVSKNNRIIFRGSGSGAGGTELYMKNTLPPKNPEQMWTVPPLFIFSAGGKDQKIGIVQTAADRGSFSLQLNTAEKLKKDDWIMLSMQNNDPALIGTELTPHQADTTWTALVKGGAEFKLYLQIKSVEGNTVQLKVPLPCAIEPKHIWEVLKFANSEEVGIENIAFTGNWKDKFVHHRSWKDDSGFTIFKFSRCTNSWMKNCRFTDCNVAATISQSANITIENCVVSGNAGHEAISNTGGTNILLKNLTDEASMWHSFGSSHGAMNTVILNCSYPATTCFEAHASQPRNTLLDNVTGGLMQNRGGGAIENMPNHMSGLVLWNYVQSNEAKKKFEFWPSWTPWWKIPNPVIAGFTSSGTTFAENQLGALESLGTKVTPISLYEAQLKLRQKK